MRYFFFMRYNWSQEEIANIVYDCHELEMSPTCVFVLIIIFPFFISAAPMF